MPKLPQDISRMIDQLCHKGDQFVQIDQTDDALDQYEAAWDLLPEPKNQWPAGTWILMAVGDVQFARAEFAAAIQTLRQAVTFPDGEANPFLWLRLGQCLFELGDIDGAAASFENCHRLAGTEIFADEDAKYLTFAKTRLGIGRVQSKNSS